MRVLVAVVVGGLSVVLLIAGVRGSAEHLFAAIFGTGPKGSFKGVGQAAGQAGADQVSRSTVGQIAGQVAGDTVTGPGGAGGGRYLPNASFGQSGQAAPLPLGTGGSPVVWA